MAEYNSRRLLNESYGCIGLVTQPSDPAATEPEGYICVMRREPPTCFFLCLFVYNLGNIGTFNLI